MLRVRRPAWSTAACLTSPLTVPQCRSQDATPPATQGGPLPTGLAEKMILGPIANRSVGRVWCTAVPDHGEYTQYVVWPAGEISVILIGSRKLAGPCAPNLPPPSCR